MKDFVDILIMAEFGTISGERLLQAIQATFSAQQTHASPTSVPSPPSRWESEFRRMANDIGMINMTLEQAYGFIQSFLDPILKGENPEMWDPTGKLWR